MEPVLKRAEIATLLKAIKDGKVSLGQEDHEQERYLPCTPINIFQLTRPDSEQFRIPNFDERQVPDTATAEYFHHYPDSA
jgi:hypothetical protein